MRRKKRINVEQAFREYKNNDISLKNLSKKYDVCRTTLVNRFKEKKFNYKKYRKVESDGKDINIKRAFEEFKNEDTSLTDLAEKYNASRTFFYRNFKKENLPYEKYTNKNILMKTMEDAKKVHAEYLNGKSAKEIAEEYNVCPSLVWKRFRKYNLRTKLNKGGQRSFSKIAEEKKCEICGESRLTCACHIIPKSKGGKYIEKNIIYLCPLHHELYDRGELNCEERKILINKEGKRVFEDHSLRFE